VKIARESNMPWLLKWPHLPGICRNFDVWVQCTIFQHTDLSAPGFLGESHMIWLKSLHAKCQGHWTCPDCWNEHSFPVLAGIFMCKFST
jgi:hypothetical protein